MSLLPIDRDPFWRDRDSIHQPLSLFPTTGSVGMPDFFQRSIRDMERSVQDMDRQMRTFMQQSSIQQQHQDTSSIFPHSMNDRSGVEPAITTDENGQRKLVWNFDCNAFKPEDITITTTGNRLEVKARHEDRGEHHQQVREFSRLVTLPESVKAPEMRSRLGNSGVLTIEAPYYEQQGQQRSPSSLGHRQEREIQIRHT